MMSTVRKLFWFGGFGLFVVAAWATGIHWQLLLAPLLIGVGLGAVVFSGQVPTRGWDCVHSVAVGPRSSTTRMRARSFRLLQIGV
jgi:hypothetical protein